VVLLDVNVLIALADVKHEHHRRATQWFGMQKANGWATCPLSELGFLRIVSNASYGSGAMPLDQALEYMAEFANMPEHRFVPDSIPAVEATHLSLSMLKGHQQVTDAYLLALCRKHDLKLATLDHKLAKTLAANEPHLLELI
jgi:toxin-antitoxin system PIN domain toxin